MDINRKINQGIKWNAILYATRKILSTILTIFLFKKLTTQDFSLWANIFSSVYLILLWSDFGLRKSLPKYCPQFAKNKKTMSKFIKYIVLFQTIVLTTLLPIFIILSKYATNILNITNKIEVFFLGCGLFFTEGIISIFRLIYHSYFWQKQFNSLMSIVVILKSLLLFIWIFKITKSYALLKLVFATELFACIIIIIIAAIMLKSLYVSKNCLVKQKSSNNLTKEFVFHSGVIWINSNIKSLSERNFMMLFFSHLFGPIQANIFKLSNDCAILFQRIVMKTIGTTDTSFFANIEIKKNNTKLIKIAFKQLIQKISFIIVPLIGILLPILINFSNTLQNKFIFRLFFLLTNFYLLESILSPCERLLEVKKRYFLLFLSYCPYIISLFFVFNFATYLGIVKIIIFIYSAKIFGYLTMLYLATKKYKVSFPVKTIIKMLIHSAILFSLTSLLSKMLIFAKPLIFS